MNQETLLKQLTEHQLVMAKFIHEIRNPLALINCELQMLISSHPDTENWPEIPHIQDQIMYIKNLISEFSDYNNAGRLTVQSTNMYSFLNAIADSFRPMFDYLGICFTTHFPVELPHIPVDSLRLRQAIINLLRNAEEAISHNDGEIIFSADSSAAHFHIMISDNGCGISTEDLPHIGKPFVTHKENGTGLGLSITRQIIEGHGGVLKLESIPSKGTTVHLYLPLS